MFTNLQVLSSFKGSDGYLRIYVFFQGQTFCHIYIINSDKLDTLALGMYIGAM